MVLPAECAGHLCLLVEGDLVDDPGATGRGGLGLTREAWLTRLKQLLADHIGEKYDAIVTGSSSKGTYVRLLRPPAEGRVLRGEKGMDVGDRVKVKLLGTDAEKGWIDFERA